MSLLSEKNVDEFDVPKQPNPMKIGGHRNSALRLPAIFVWLLWILSAGIVAYLMIAYPSKHTVGILTMILMLALMLVRVPVGASMLLSSAVGLYSLGGTSVVFGSLETIMFSSVSQWSLSVIPLFVFMGIAMWRGGLTTRAYAAAQQWLGKLPGGLAIATNFAGAGLAAGSGSTIGISHALGRMAIPEMLKTGYHPTLAVGVVTMAGTLGQLIPPSIILVIYAGVAQVPVGPQLIAAMVPGLLIACAYAIAIVVWAKVKPSHAPRATIDATWGTRFRALGGVVPLALIVFVVIGGMLFGFFTATEAGAFGALAAFVMTWIMAGKGKRGPKATFTSLVDIARETVTSIAPIFVLLIGVHLLTRLMALSGLAQDLTSLIIEADLSRVGLLLILIVVYLFLGLFLDSLAMMLLTVPLLQASLESLGVDMIWFGVFVVILAELAVVTPPVGMLLFIMDKLLQDKDVGLGHRYSIMTVIKGVIPFIISCVALLVVFVFFPGIIEWLPGIMAN